tara:strand:- start:38 stop:205 length:168 start_codon:yes stop_codon:yes gene_type:complete
MSVLSKYIQKQIRKKGLTGIIMYVIKQYVKATPSEEDDKFVAEIEKKFRDFEALR